MKLEFPSLILEKYSNLKFQENPSSGSQAVPCGQKTDRKTRTKLLLFTILQMRLKTVIMISRNIVHNTMNSFFPFTYCFYMKPDDDSGIWLTHTAQ